MLKYPWFQSMCLNNLPTIPDLFEICFSFSQIYVKRVWRNCNILYRNYISIFQASTWNIHKHVSPYLEGVQLVNQTSAWMQSWLRVSAWLPSISCNWFLKTRKQILSQFKNNFMWKVLGKLALNVLYCIVELVTNNIILPFFLKSTLENLVSFDRALLVS